ncbi:U-box domain-containing protein 32-like, partial [Trifolium pratense]
MKFELDLSAYCIANLYALFWSWFCIAYLACNGPVREIFVIDTNVSEYEHKDHAIKAFKEHGSQTVHEFLDQYILTLVP